MGNNISLDYYKHIHNLWTIAKYIKEPKGIFGNKCPVCGKKLKRKIYKVGENNNGWAMWATNEYYDFIYHSCGCGYEYCQLKMYAIFPHHPKYDGDFTEVK